MEEIRRIKNTDDDGEFSNFYLMVKCATSYYIVYCILQWAIEIRRTKYLNDNIVSRNTSSYDGFCLRLIIAKSLKRATNRLITTTRGVSPPKNARANYITTLFSVGHIMVNGIKLVNDFRRYSFKKKKNVTNTHRWRSTICPTFIFKTNVERA